MNNDNATYKGKRKRIRLIAQWTRWITIIAMLFIIEDGAFIVYRTGNHILGWLLALFVGLLVALAW